MTTTSTPPRMPVQSLPDDDLVWIPCGTFKMGSDKVYPEERPVHRGSVDGHQYTSPVGSFPANGFGLYDMAGTSGNGPPTGTRPASRMIPGKSCCAPENPRGGREVDSYDPNQPQFRIPRKVVKGAPTSVHRPTASATDRPRASPR